MTSGAILIEANRLIEQAGFARHAHAYDSEGTPVTHLSPNAVSFCVVGAIVRAAFDLGEIPSSELSEPLREALYRVALIGNVPPGMSLTQWSDVVSEERVRRTMSEAALMADVCSNEQLALSA